MTVELSLISTTAPFKLVKLAFFIINSCKLFALIPPITVP